jgi:hypothetical protein
VQGNVDSRDKGVVERADAIGSEEEDASEVFERSKKYSLLLASILNDLYDKNLGQKASYGKERMVYLIPSCFFQDYRTSVARDRRLLHP